MSITQQLSSVKNALRILRCFTLEAPEQRVTDIAERLQIHKSTVSRTLATLASEGFVYKNEQTNKYRLGLSIVALSGVVNHQIDVYREAQPVLNRLVESIDETAQLSILDQLEIIYLLKVECHHPVRVLSHVGRRNPAYCTSAGKAILAFSPPGKAKQVIENGLKAFTDYTITDRDELLDHLTDIRKDGYAVSMEELLEGVTSIAAPIFDYTGQVIAALSVVGPKQRLQPHKIPTLAHKVKKAAKEISERMGYWEHLK